VTEATNGMDTIAVTKRKPRKAPKVIQNTQHNQQRSPTVLVISQYTLHLWVKESRVSYCMLLATVVALSFPWWLLKCSHICIIRHLTCVHDKLI